MKKVNSMSMFGSRGVIIIGLTAGVLAAGCDSAADSAGDVSGTGTADAGSESKGESTGATSGVGESSGSGEVPAVPGSDDELQIFESSEAGTKLCSKENDCAQICACTEGICVLPGVIWGPPPPADVCSKAPVLKCASAAECQSGCLCSAGACVDDGVGSVNPTCHLQPPDVYEVDNTWLQKSTYVGEQLHNFHRFGDEDWIAVTIGAAGKVRFATHKLNWGTDTVLEVYSYTNNVKGLLVGSHDDIGGAGHFPDDFSSRVDLTVPAANSKYLVRVTNKTPASSYGEVYYWPKYTFVVVNL